VLRGCLKQISVGFGPNETYADAGFLGWKFPVEINLCGEESSNRFLFRNRR